MKPGSTKLYESRLYYCIDMVMTAMFFVQNNYNNFLQNKGENVYSTQKLTIFSQKINDQKPGGLDVQYKLKHQLAFGFANRSLFILC